MHNPYRNKELLKIFGIIVASCVLLIFFVHFFYSEFPEKTKKINANILIVEGWLPTPALEKAKYEFQHDGYDILIITGLNFTENYYPLSMNGYLIFYPNIKFIRTQADDFHIIEVNAFSELGVEDRAHFNFFVNNSLVADFFAGKQKKNMVSGGKGNLKILIL